MKLKVLLLVCVIVVLYLSTKYSTSSHNKHNSSNDSESTQTESSTIGIGVYGDWTVDKVRPPEGNSFFGRTLDGMCADVQQHLFRDTNEEEDIIFHKASKLIDETFKSNQVLTTAKIEVFWHMGAVKQYTYNFQRVSDITYWFISC